MTVVHLDDYGDGWMCKGYRPFSNPLATLLQALGSTRYLRPGLLGSYSVLVNDVLGRPYSKSQSPAKLDPRGGLSGSLWI